MNDYELDQLLKSGDCPVKSPVEFQRGVWLRIEAAEPPPGWVSLAERTLRRFLDFFTLPPVALATCAATIMAGAWLGLNEGKQTVSGEIAYVQSISPFIQSHQ